MWERGGLVLVQILSPFHEAMHQLKPVLVGGSLEFPGKLCERDQSKEQLDSRSRTYPRQDLRRLSGYLEVLEKVGDEW